MAEPPLLPAAIFTVSWALLAVMLLMVGAPGIVAGVADTAALGVPSPTAFTANTRTP